MPSTNKTATLGLNQWIKTDGVCMADFNADNAKLEAAIAAVAAARVQFYTGTYTGDGTCGSANPTSITLPFAPKVFIIYRADQDYPPTVILAGMTKANTHFTYMRGGGINVTFDGNTVSWYHNGHYFDESNNSMTTSASANIQLNEKNAVYNFMAIGYRD